MKVTIERMVTLSSYDKQIEDMPVPHEYWSIAKGEIESFLKSKLKERVKVKLANKTWRQGLEIQMYGMFWGFIHWEDHNDSTYLIEEGANNLTLWGQPANSEYRLKANNLT